MRYSPERKESVLRKMMPPHNRSIKQLAQEEGILEATLFNWRKQTRAKGLLLPDGDSGPEGWSTRNKVAAVLETNASFFIILSLLPSMDPCRQANAFMFSYHYNCNFTNIIIKY